MNPPVPTRDLFAWHRALRCANTRKKDDATVVEPVLSRQALALALVIGTFMDSDGTTSPRWSPGLDKLSDALGYRPSDHRKAVSRLVAELGEAGYLIVTSRCGRFTPNLYTAAVPADRVAGTPGADDGGVAGLVDGAPNAGSSVDAPPVRPGTDAATGAAPARQFGPETAACAPANSGTLAAQPSRVFSTPSPARGGQDGTNPTAGSVTENRPDTTLTTQLFRTALAGMPAEAANAVMMGVRQLPNKWDLARQVNALCAVGAREKVVAELARPYTGARRPAAVAASRVAGLYVAYGRPPTP